MSPHKALPLNLVRQYSSSNTLLSSTQAQADNMSKMPSALSLLGSVNTKTSLATPDPSMRGIGTCSYLLSVLHVPVMSRELDVVRRETKRHAQEGILLRAQTHKRSKQVQIHLHMRIKLAQSPCVCVCAPPYTCVIRCVTSPSFVPLCLGPTAP